MRSLGVQGFTLIELSIVLIIIGLVIGGVLVGRDLIRASEYRSIISDWEKFETAHKTFKLKYNCIPGDCATATDYGLGTNGNGNFYVDTPTSGGLVDSWLYWTHLANAQLIEGSYTGLAGAGGTFDAVVGTNVPASKYKGVGYSIWGSRPFTFSWSTSWGVARPLETHLIATGIHTHTDNWQTWGAIFLPLEVRAFDIKIDDGLANNGRVRTHTSWSGHGSTGCTTGSVPNYTYSNSITSICNMFYLFIP